MINGILNNHKKKIDINSFTQIYFTQQQNSSERKIKSMIQKPIQQQSKPFINQIPKSQSCRIKASSYRIKVQYMSQIRYYEIPYDIELRGMVEALRRWFNVPNKDSIFLCMKRGTRILNFDTKLSQLMSQASLLTEKVEKIEHAKTFNDMKKSHQFMEKDIVRCEAFIQLKMVTHQTTG